MLLAHEILGLELDADLVALSACNTAFGPLAGGEGVLGLTRAFLYAGAQSLLLSFWEVADRSTVAFMGDFYTLGEKLETDDALRETQLLHLARRRGSGRPSLSWDMYNHRAAPVRRRARRGWPVSCWSSSRASWYCAASAGGRREGGRGMRADCLPVLGVRSRPHVVLGNPFTIAGKRVTLRRE